MDIKEALSQTEKKYGETFKQLARGTGENVYESDDSEKVVNKSDNNEKK